MRSPDRRKPSPDLRHLHRCRNLSPRPGVLSSTASYLMDGSAYAGLFHGDHGVVVVAVAAAAAVAAGVGALLARSTAGRRPTDQRQPPPGQTQTGRAIQSAPQTRPPAHGPPSSGLVRLVLAGILG